MRLLFIRGKSNGKHWPQADAVWPFIWGITTMASACCATAIDMETVTVSPKFQLVIPSSIRTALQLVPGEKPRVLRHKNRVKFIPVRPICEMRGFLKNMDTGIDREGDRL
jgi:AbrB family looped-hinge helix DNA binding protein